MLNDTRGTSRIITQAKAQQIFDFLIAKAESLKMTIRKKQRCDGKTHRTAVRKLTLALFENNPGLFENSSNQQNSGVPDGHQRPAFRYAIGLPNLDDAPGCIPATRIVKCVVIR